MATVRPFRGIVFDPTRVPDLGLVTCPPYDVISPEERERLYERHPYNVVRIVSGRDEPGDDDRDNKYVRAASFFRSWLWEGVLRQERQEALYAYRQAFRDPAGHFRRVWGLIGTICLDDPILSHEHTMAGPKADRLALMEAIAANLSPIYALYREPGGGVSAELRSFGGEAPVADFVDDEGTRHTVWVARDEGFAEKVAASLEGLPLLIADGHHRFETAKLYRERRRPAGPGPWDHIMALLVDAGSEPVCILPYHRIVLRCRAPDPLAVLAEGFEVRPLGRLGPSEATQAGLQLWDDPRPGVFVAFTAQGAFELVARDASPEEIPAGVLKRLALDPLGASAEGGDLAFSPRAAEVAGEVAGGRAVCGFLMQPVDVQRVWDLAASGATMPEKSTYFHPKPRDGIVIRPLEV